MRAKKRFGDLKVGAKFYYQRCLCFKEDTGFGVRLSNGRVIPYHDLNSDSLVTPVKVKFEVI